MAYWTTLKAAIANIINTNGNQEITGQLLQNTLNSIVNAVGENATFAGVAGPTTNPGAPDGPVFYLANTPGVYSNFSGLVLSEGLNILIWNNTAWNLINLIAIAQELGISKTIAVSQKEVTKIYDAVKGYVYYENTAVGATDGYAGRIGFNSEFDAIIIPAPENTEMEIVGIPTSVIFANSSICYFSDRPDFTGKQDGSFISQGLGIHTSKIKFTTPAGTKYIGLSIASKNRIPANERDLIAVTYYGSSVKNQTLDKVLDKLENGLSKIKEQIPFINHDLGTAKNFNFEKYDDICLIMNGQSLSLGWESVAISTEPTDNCYMLGTDPCTYNIDGLNGVGINPLKSVTRESPNVSWCNVLSKLIPNKRFITSSVGEGAMIIANLSKTNGSTIVEAEFIGHRTVNPGQGNIGAINPAWISFVIAVRPGETYYITNISEYITEFSEKPRWSPIDNAFNNSIYVGNGASHISNNQYTVPDGVFYLGLTQNNPDYVTEKAFLIKGTANRYEKGFMLPMAQLKAVEDNNNRTIGCPAIVWMQGESDSTRTKEYYKEKFIKLKNDMQSDIMKIFGQSEKPLFFCYMLALTDQKENNVMMAITECCEENDDMILIAPIYALPDYKNLHLATNGYRWYGEYIARSTYNALILGIRDSCVAPYQFLIDGNNLKIKVKAHKLPLVIDTWTVQEVPQFGFKIWKDNVEIVINSVSLYGDEITLHCSEDISNGIIEVSYAGYNPSDTIHYRGTGNIRDSDRWLALQTYWDDTNDKGTGGVSEITYRPKTKTGESLNGKPYPMQNWLQNFYKKIE